MLQSIGLLFLANIFMTVAWYGHLKTLKDKSLWMVILISWSIALVEYCFQVPANRIGFKYFTLPQLKVIQEIVTMLVFSIFAIYFMKVPITKNYMFASICLVMAAYFIFKDSPA